MKQIDYLRKSRKNCSALLMACALTFMLLTTTLSFAQTNSLTLGCPTANGSGYSFTSLTLSTSTSVRGVTISFSENPEGCSISATTPSDWNLSSTSNDYNNSFNNFFFKSKNINAIVFAITKGIKPKVKMKPQESHE